MSKNTEIAYEHYKCSCGFKFKALIINEGARKTLDGISEIVLAAHKNKKGHKLLKIEAGENKE